MLDTHAKVLLALLPLCLLTACGQATEPAEATDAELCEQAADHVQGCFPDQQVRQPETCTAESAQATLDQSCDDLTGEASAQADGKADGYCNPWFWWTCDSGSDDTNDDSTNDNTNDDSDSTTEEYGRLDEREVWVRLKSCSSDVCGNVSGGLSCTRVTIEDNQGNVVATGYTGSHNDFRSSAVLFEDIELGSGTYYVNVWRRDGELGEIMVEEDEWDYGYSARAEARVELEIERYEDEYDVDLYFEQDTREAYGRCVDIDATITSTCEGEAMSAEDTEWGWFIQFEGQTDAGELVDITRPFDIRDVNRFGSTLLPGDYQMTIHEMDIPSYRRDNNPDYERLLRYYDTGRTFAESLTITDADMNTSVDLGEYALDHQDCR